MKAPLPKKPQGASQLPAQQGAPLPTKETKTGSAMEERVKKLSRTATAAVAAAALGVTFGIYSLASANAEIAKTKEGMVNVVVAAQQIDAGSTITDDKVKIVEVPEAYVSSGAVSETDGFVGQVALTRIDSGTQVTPSVVAGSNGSGSLSSALHQNYKAVTIAVDEVQGFAGLLKVGDTVDVLSNENSLNGGSGSLTRITSNAVVIALGSSLADSDSSYSTVTLEVMPNEADAIRNAQANGNVSLELHPTTPSQE